MSQLIALIIAIALGAIVTAIGYVFLGDAFTKNSERGVALQFVNQSSQVEMAMTAYRAEEAKTAATSGDWSATETTLVTAGFLKDGLVAPQGAYSLVSDSSGNNWLVVDAATTEFALAVCTQINKLGEVNDAGDNAPTALTAVDAATIAGATGLNGSRYGCFTGGTGHVFAYEVD